ncbi:hypothetical protein C7T36_07305 [Rhodococcus sp. AD45-ID]|nr:hypothetical protein C7T36_07305 [Rhodococcus sp. AD45-ID]
MPPSDETGCGPTSTSYIVKLPAASKAGLRTVDLESEPVEFCAADCNRISNRVFGSHRQFLPM